MASRGMYHTLALIFGIVGSVLAVLAVLVYEGWLSPAQVDNFTDVELGAFAVLSITAAIASSIAEKRE